VKGDRVQRLKTQSATFQMETKFSRIHVDDFDKILSIIRSELDCDKVDSEWFCVPGDDLDDINF